MKKRVLYLFLPILTLILEILPYGAVCNFAPGPNENIRETYSYFDLIPFGYANFAPFLTAIVTCAVIAMLVIYLFSASNRVLVSAKVLLCVGAALSVCPMLYGIHYYSLVGALITVSLVAETVFLFVHPKRLSEKQWMEKLENSRNQDL